MDAKRKSTDKERYTCIICANALSDECQDYCTGFSHFFDDTISKEWNDAVDSLFNEGVTLLRKPYGFLTSDGLLYRHTYEIIEDMYLKRKAKRENTTFQRKWGIKKEGFFPVLWENAFNGEFSEGRVPAGVYGFYFIIDGSNVYITTENGETEQTDISGLLGKANIAEAMFWAHLYKSEWGFSANGKGNYKLSVGSIYGGEMELDSEDFIYFSRLLARDDAIFQRELTA